MTKSPLLHVSFTCCKFSDFEDAEVNKAVLKFENPIKDEVSESNPEQLNGSFSQADDNTEGQFAEQSAGYQINMTDAGTLDDGTYTSTNFPEADKNTSGLTFFQTSELETDVYPTSAHGFPSGGISFLQESELDASQPREDYTAEREDVVDDLAGSPQLPPIETFESEAPPKVNLGVGTFAGADIGEPGNPAAETMLSSQLVDKFEPKTDWAEEVASPTHETAPPLEKKKEEEEWTTQSSRHSRHQSQQRGRGGGQRGGKEGWRGGEGRGGRGGGYRGGRGGDRGDRGGDRPGASNGERRERGPWRGGERGGRGRGGSNGIAPSA